ncbi:MerR family transcriptional regulator [Morganella morganii]|uniref:MerR family transcriptional regulator n=1 Tax=Morganella morganii TaxID=582 RepID=UPI001BDB5920|nr:MerR family transcriptional regulator [Morganella morganii]MBT0520856.1 MerR family transcriptional regulator [Morganella morganii subsp. morganii]QWL89453.1 MerR family transcriptional regulator [Morganella morganii subsp. morganii]
MKKYFTIGETAALLGVSTQTLRFYDKKSILKPGYTDNENGYRYYTFEQFHYIDRIKYLQKMNMNLSDIKTIMESGDKNKLTEYLIQEKSRKLQQMAELKKTIETLDWYLDYFTFTDNKPRNGGFYTTELPERWCLFVPCYPADRPISKMELRLAEMKARPENQSLDYLRQYAYVLDYQNIIEQTFYPSKYLIYLKEKPDFDSPNLVCLPAGFYLCCICHYLSENIDAEIVKRYFHGKEKPRMVIANEFEDNLVSYESAPYELQFLIS